jgi:hypothetical protein
MQIDMFVNEPKKLSAGERGGLKRQIADKRIEVERSSTRCSTAM